MLRFNFNRIFKARGIDKPFSYLVNAGYSANFATRIANNRPQTLQLKHVEKLCEILQCTPNDLLQWTPSNNQPDINKHPLKPLLHSNSVLHLTQLLSSVPLNKLSELETVIRKELDL